MKLGGFDLIKPFQGGVEDQIIIYLQVQALFTENIQ